MTAKKRFYVTAAAVAALVACTFAFASCGEESEVVTDTDASISEDYKAAEVQTKLERMRTESNGFFVKYEITGRSTGGEEGDEEESYTVAFGAKGDVYCVMTEDDEMYFDIGSEEYAVIYEKLEDYEGSTYWEKNVRYYTEDYTKAQVEASMKAEAMSVLSWMSYYGTAVVADHMTKASASFVGRSCDKYTWEENYIVYKTSLECYIDKETGVCLKWTAGGSAQGVTASVSFECREFSDDPSFSLPEVSAEHTNIYGLDEIEDEI